MVSFFLFRAHIECYVELVIAEKTGKNFETQNI